MLKESHLLICEQLLLEHAIFVVGICVDVEPRDNVFSQARIQVQDELQAKAQTDLHAGVSFNVCERLRSTNLERKRLFLVGFTDDEAHCATHR